jgi:ppGpp synthetase/RelA/SpoT-type nucleotidyltranferase
MTKSQINRLGEQLRTRAFPEAEHLARLQEFRASYDPPMTKAQALLKDKLDLRATARLKTINTIIEKLRREKTRLAEMQDIAGLRVVLDIGIVEQSALVERIRERFDRAEIIDRREKPSHGYRAVHVVARVDGYPVEIQVRTELQDRWAQAMERLADEVGRGIRYGEPPPTRKDEVTRLHAISDFIAAIELARSALKMHLPSDAVTEDVLRATRTLDELSERIRAMLS